MSSVSKMMQELRESGAIEKTASAAGDLGLTSDDEQTVKLAEDCYAAGRIMGHGWIAGVLEKLADAPVSATGQTQPSQGNESNDQSQMKRIAGKVMNFKGMASAGSTPNIAGGNPDVVAETVAPPQAKTTNTPEKTGG